MNIIYEKTTDKTVAQAIESVKAELKKREFGVLFELDMKAKLQEHNLELNGHAVIMDVCNPKQAQKVLNESLSVGYFLPCKIAVFSRDGKTTIGTLLPSELMEQMPGLDLKETAEAVEQVLRESVDAAANT